MHCLGSEETRSAVSGSLADFRIGAANFADAHTRRLGLFAPMRPSALRAIEGARLGAVRPVRCRPASIVEPNTTKFRRLCGALYESLSSVNNKKEVSRAQ